jgi:flagellar motor switch protein FliM
MWWNPLKVDEEKLAEYEAAHEKKRQLMIEDAKLRTSIAHKNRLTKLRHEVAREFMASMLTTLRTPVDVSDDTLYALAEKSVRAANVFIDVVGDGEPSE